MLHASYCWNTVWVRILEESQCWFNVWKNYGHTRVRVLPFESSIVSSSSSEHTFLQTACEMCTKCWTVYLTHRTVHSTVQYRVSFKVSCNIAHSYGSVRYCSTELVKIPHTPQVHLTRYITVCVAMCAVKDVLAQKHELFVDITHNTHV